jgi:hypothetical protein
MDPVGCWSTVFVVVLEEVSQAGRDGPERGGVLVELVVGLVGGEHEAGVKRDHPGVFSGIAGAVIAGRHPKREVGQLDVSGALEQLQGGVHGRPSRPRSQVGRAIAERDRVQPTEWPSSASMSSKLGEHELLCELVWFCQLRRCHAVGHGRPLHVVHPEPVSGVSLAGEFDGEDLALDAWVVLAGLAGGGQ